MHEDGLRDVSPDIFPHQRSSPHRIKPSGYPSQLPRDHLSVELPVEFADVPYALGYQPNTGVS